jgi:selenocysteine-specific elongation factor
MRVLGTDTLWPGSAGSVRMFLPVALPMLPGDRYVLRESGRDETVGGGQVLDIAPVTKASRAAPDGSVGRAIAERGWIDVDQLELLTGAVVEPSVGHWVATADELDRTRRRLSDAISASGVAGLDMSTLEDHERAVVATLDGVTIEGGRARLGTDDPFADHPLAAQILAGGYAPDIPLHTDRATVRELTRRGVLVERDQLLFHRDTIAAAARVASELLHQDPSGFTVATFRERTGTSRKFALPILAELDATGVTRRRDDLRIAGPRLPDYDERV